MLYFQPIKNLLIKTKKHNSRTNTIHINSNGCKRFIVSNKVFDFNFGVKKAVDEFCFANKHNLSLQYYGDWYYQVSDSEKIPARNWMFIK